MKKLLLLLVLVMGLSACSSSTPKVTKISPETAYEMMQTQEVVIVDVRTLAEFQLGYIAGAILIPNETINAAPAQLPDKDAIILVYCRSGNRSAQASQKLASYGYTQVYDFGGIISWPFDIVQ
jgi:phage shock protein E